MPGPVSDSYDPEWGTGHNKCLIDEALDGVYKRLSKVLGNQQPMFIVDLVQDEELTALLSARLTEKEWRLLRFCVERARESL